jgi:AcrR family transcriptional regulator
VQNSVPVAEALAERAVAERRGQYAAEVRRLLDAAFAVLARTGSLDPPVRAIVREAGLSNQAFYRHFASKDALLLALLADGQARLVEHLRARLETAGDARRALDAWIRVVMAQARDPQAAAATRPFARNGARLADRFPAEVAASRDELLATLRPTVGALGGDRHAADFVHDLTMARLHEALAHGKPPDRREVDALVAFCVAALEGGSTDGA